MNSKITLLGTVLGLVALSVSFVISYTSGGTQFTQDIDPRFQEVTKNGFTISSNLDVYSIIVEDEIQGISITTSSNTDGFIEMDDPLPILQKIFPEKNIKSFIVLSDLIEIPYTLEDGKLGISVNNSNVILIVGFSQI